LGESRNLLFDENLSREGKNHRVSLSHAAEKHENITQQERYSMYVLTKKILWGRRQADLFVMFGLLFSLSACSLTPSTPALSTPTSTLTPQPPTATVVWFPATETPTPTPMEIKSPTPEQRPGIGDLVFQDHFGEDTAWQTSLTESGSIAYGNNDLTLVVAAEKRNLQSFYFQQIPYNSYLEITANPSLCRARDSYGLLLRAQSDASYYRFVLACTGEVRVERYRNGDLAVLQDWTVSGQVPPGAPYFLRLGVWMYGEELRFFINDGYQFSVTDPVFQAGQLGVFARTADKPPLTVSFSDLAVYAIE
jgi:hypothetical protein